jgi:DNA-binding transcriptional MocR family regulator
MLAVSRGTVVQAYAALARAGAVESRRGSGTYVSAGTFTRPLPARRAPSARLPRLIAAVPEDGSAADSGLIELSAATSSWLDVLSGDLLAQAMSDPALIGGHGYAPLGIPSYRSAVARWLTAEGLPTREEQIVATTGAQQAIALVASLYVGRGDRVALEDPTYTGAIDVLGSSGARIATVPVDEDGVRVDGLRELAESELLRLVYLVPTFHNPTGVTLTPARRREVARLSKELDLPVVDDMTMAGLWLERPSPPPLATYAPDAPIITVGSLSKLFWGGLRLGWIRSSEQLVPALARLKAVADLGSSVISQAIGTVLLDRSDEIAAIRRRQLAEAIEVVVAELSRLLPDWSWEPPAGGATAWVQIPYGDAEEFAQLAVRHGVLVLPGSVTSPANGHRDRLRLPLLRDAAELKEGIQRLAAAWAGYAPGPQADRGELLRVIV